MSAPASGGGALYQELILDHSRTPEGQGDPRAGRCTRTR